MMAGQAHNTPVMNTLSKIGKLRNNSGWIIFLLICIFNISAMTQKLFVLKMKCESKSHIKDTQSLHYFAKITI